MENSADVVIVGGAITGSAIAWNLKGPLAFDGRVVVIEKDRSYRYCSTTLSAASIRQQYSTPINITLSQYSIGFLRDVRRHLGEDADIGLRENGYLLLWGDDTHEAQSAQFQLQREHDVDVVELTPQAIEAKWNWLRAGGARCGTFGCTGEGSLDAYSLLTAMRRAAIREGVEYVDDEVIGIDLKSGPAGGVAGVSLAGGGRIHAGQVVNAAGPAAAGVAAMAGIEMPVESRKRCVFVIHCRELEHMTEAPLVIDSNGVWFRPEGQYFICGVAPPHDRDPVCTDHVVDHDLFDEIVWPSLAHRVPAFEAVKVVNAWAGHYAVNTLDHNAILGRHPELPNFILANGFSGHGLQHSPAVGRGLAELISFGEYRTVDLGPLGWERIAANRPMREQAVF
jgi:glycine/D-amino acid oxidase-like deaminating enzyme